MEPTHALYDVDPFAITICKQGANRKRIFLKKSGGDPEFELPAPHRILKDGDEWTTFYCVVAEPGWPEHVGQGDGAGTDIVDVWKSEDEIRKAAHRFALNKGYVNAMHDALAEEGCTVVENAVALDDIYVGADVIKKGSWYVGIQPSPEFRAAVESGEITGVSLEGSGFREVLQKALPPAFAANAKKKQANRLASEGKTAAQIAAKLGISEDEVKKLIGVKKAKDDSPDKAIPNKPGKTNWVERAGGLPRYIRRIAEDLHAKGHDVSKSIQLAVGIVKNWAEGKGGVSAKTKAKAAAALAEWEAKKAKSKSMTAASSVAKEDDVELDPAELDELTCTLWKEMDGEDRTLIRKLMDALGIGADELADADELRKAQTFASLIASRELNNELPTAFSTLQDAVWYAFYPSSTDKESGVDPAALVEQSLDEFKSYCLELLSRIDVSGDAKVAVAKALGREPDSLPVESDTLEDTGEDVDTETAQKLQKAVEDNSAATTKLIDLVEKLVTRKPESDDDGDGDGGGDKKSDLKKALEGIETLSTSFVEQAGKLDDLQGTVQALAEAESSQHNDPDNLRKQADEHPLAGLLA